MVGAESIAFASTISQNIAKDFARWRIAAVVGRRWQADSSTAGSSTASNFGAGRFLPGCDGKGQPPLFLGTGPSGNRLGERSVQRASGRQQDRGQYRGNGFRPDGALHRAATRLGF